MKKAITFLLGVMVGMLSILALQSIGSSKDRLIERFSIKEEFSSGEDLALPLTSNDFKRSYGSISYRWELIDTDNETVRLDEYKGKVIFLNIWATWCGPCIAEMPEIQEFMKYLGEDVTFLLVTRESVETVTKFINKNRYNISFDELPLYSSAKKPPRKLDMSTYPTTYLIDKKGHIRYKRRGATEWTKPALITYVRSLVEEKG